MLHRVRQMNTRLGQRIKELRIERGLSQRRLAEESGVIRPTVTRHESGKHTPTIENVVAYAKSLGVKPSEILHVLDWEEPTQ